MGVLLLIQSVSCKSYIQIELVSLMTHQGCHTKIALLIYLDSLNSSVEKLSNVNNTLYKACRF